MPSTVSTVKKRDHCFPGILTLLGSGAAAHVVSCTPPERTALSYLRSASAQPDRTVPS